MEKIGDAPEESEWNSEGIDNASWLILREESPVVDIIEEGRFKYDSCH